MFGTLPLSEEQPLTSCGLSQFQNSSILDRDTDVQPHIYHSSGDMKGLPEPFPAPNDSARKARSMAAAQEVCDSKQC